MYRRRRPMATVAAILCLIAVAACGTDTTAQFKKGYAAARVPLNQTLAAVTVTLNHLQGQSLTEIISRFGSLSARFGGQLPPLLALKPPASVAIPFTTLTASMRRVSSDLKGTYAGLRDSDHAAVTLALDSLVADAGDARDAGTAIARKLAARGPAQR